MILYEILQKKFAQSIVDLTLLAIPVSLAAHLGIVQLSHFQNLLEMLEVHVQCTRSF